MGRTEGLAALGSRFGEFTVKELLHQSERSLVLRCVRGDERLVVKLLRAEPVQAADVARLRREFELSNRHGWPLTVARSPCTSCIGWSAPSFRGWGLPEPFMSSSIELVEMRPSR